jgi:hypothetical protein
MEFQNRISEGLSWRASHLEKSILSMLKEPALIDRFYAHPLLVELSIKDKNGNIALDKKGNPRRPKYIPDPIFATAAFEVIMNAGKGEKDVAIESMSIPQMTENFKSMVEKNNVLPYVFPNMEKAMDGLKKGTMEFDNMVSDYRKNVEGWFEAVMSQSSEWYKVRAQWMSFLIGLSIAIIMNVDTIHVAQKLWQEPTARAVIVAQAQATAQSETPSPENISFAAARSLNFPIGWTTTPLDTKSCRVFDIIDYQFVIRSARECLAVTSFPAFNNIWGIFVKIIGFLLTAAAASQGAPFWFDILRKLVSFKQQPAPITK